MIDGFWSISYPLGLIAMSLVDGDINAGIIQALKLSEDCQDAKSAWEKSNKRVLDEIYDFEVYIAGRSNVKMPKPICMHLWVAHMATRAVKRNDTLCYHAIQKLIEELKNEAGLLP